MSTVDIQQREDLRRHIWQRQAGYARPRAEELKDNCGKSTSIFLGGGYEYFIDHLIR